MPYLNRTTFIGNLTKAPELRFQPTADKQALCILNVALNRESRDESGEKKSLTTFVNDIEIWGPSGEACAHYLTPGSTVYVEGRLDLDQWQDKQSGAKRSKLKVVAENVQFLRIKKPEDILAEPAATVAAEPEAPSVAPRTPRRAGRGARSEA